MAQASGRGIGDRVLRALSHPIRIEVLRVLTNRIASPKELALETGEKLGNVSYHFKYLRREDCIEIVDTEPRRGAVEHYYRLKSPPPYDVAIRDFLGEAVRALNAGTFDANEDRHLSWMTMELDEEGWRELIERQAEWREDLKRMKAEAAARLAGKGTPGKRMVTGTLGFETPPGLGFPDSDA